MWHRMLRQARMTQMRQGLREPGEAHYEVERHGSLVRSNALATSGALMQRRSRSFQLRRWSPPPLPVPQREMRPPACQGASSGYGFSCVADLIVSIQARTVSRRPICVHRDGCSVGRAAATSFLLACGWFAERNICSSFTITARTPVHHRLLLRSSHTLPR